MLSAHERDGVQAEFMNWQELVQFIRIWTNECQRVKCKPVSDAELRRVQDMLEVSWCSRFHAMSRSEVSTLMQYFHVHDYDASGTIGEDELADLLVDAGLEIVLPEVHRLWREGDENEDGELDVVELIGLLKKVYKLVYESAWDEVYGDVGRPLTVKDFSKLLAVMELDDVPEEEIKRLQKKMNENYRKIDHATDEEGNFILKFTMFEKIMALVREFQMDTYRKDAGFSEQQLGYYRELFDAADADGSGTIDPVERNNILATVGKLPKNKKQQARLVSLINRIDRDNNGELDFFEFLQLCRCWENEAIREQYQQDRDIGISLGFNKEEIHYLQTIFYDVDVDGGQKIVLSEFLTMFRRIGITLDPKDQRTVNGWIREYSHDPNDLGVNFGGFLQVMKRCIAENLGGVNKRDVTKLKKKQEEREAAQAQAVIQRQKSRAVHARASLVSIGAATDEASEERKRANQILRSRKSEFLLTPHQHNHYHQTHSFFYFSFFARNTNLYVFECSTVDFHQF